MEVIFTDASGEDIFTDVPQSVEPPYLTANHGSILAGRNASINERAAAVSHAYLQILLTQQVVPPAEVGALQATRADLETTLRRIIGVAPRFYYDGSYGKDTMVRVANNLDIVSPFGKMSTEKGQAQTQFACN